MLRNNLLILMYNDDGDNCVPGAAELGCSEMVKFLSQSSTIVKEKT